MTSDQWNDKQPATRNYLRAITFNKPEWIPCHVGMMWVTWQKYRQELEEIILRHPRLFPGYRGGTVDYDRPGTRETWPGQITDTWGCVWRNETEGMRGIVVGHPLEQWEKLETYQPPDPLAVDDMGNPVDWTAQAEQIKRAKEQGCLARASIHYGGVFERLYFLRGFENLMLDIATDEPRLYRLIELVRDYHLRMIEKFAHSRAEFLYFGDDIGLQDRFPISPKSFRRFLRPCYEEIFTACKKAGMLVWFRSDGHILPIVDDLAECGVDLMHAQIRSNDVAELRQKQLTRTVAISLDLDRQLFPFATPRELEDHIVETVEALRDKQGGLQVYAQCLPDVPLENIEVICDTLEKLGGGPAA